AGPRRRAPALGARGVAAGRATGRRRDWRLGRLAAAAAAARARGATEKPSTPCSITCTTSWTSLCRSAGRALRRETALLPGQTVLRFAYAAPAVAAHRVQRASAVRASQVAPAPAASR